MHTFTIMLYPGNQCREQVNKMEGLDNCSTIYTLSLDILFWRSFFSIPLPAQSKRNLQSSSICIRGFHPRRLSASQQKKACRCRCLIKLTGHHITIEDIRIINSVLHIGRFRHPYSAVHPILQYLLCYPVIEYPHIIQKHISPNFSPQQKATSLSLFLKYMLPAPLQLCVLAKSLEAIEVAVVDKGDHLSNTNFVPAIRRKLQINGKLSLSGKIVYNGDFKCYSCS